MSYGPRGKGVFYAVHVKLGDGDPRDLARLVREIIDGRRGAHRIGPIADGAPRALAAPHPLASRGLRSLRRAPAGPRCDCRLTPRPSRRGRQKHGRLAHRRYTGALLGAAAGHAATAPSGASCPDGRRCRNARARYGHGSLGGRAAERADGLASLRCALGGHAARLAGVRPARAPLATNGALGPARHDPDVRGAHPPERRG